MNSVKQSNIDELLMLKRKYRETSDVSLCEKAVSIAEVISTEICGNATKWLAVLNFTDGVCGINPIKDCTNEEVYDLFEKLGFTVERSNSDECDRNKCEAL